MNFSSQSIYDILVEKGITHLYHANSLITSCHYLLHGSLLSRQKVDDLNYPQTSQYTDPMDKRYKIYNSIFLDSCDLHARMDKINDYGPVMFKINIDILNNSTTGNVRITKSNPSDWGASKNGDWFKSLSDIEKKFEKFTFGQMLVFSYCNGVLPLGDFLETVIVDDPRIKYDKVLDLYSYAAGALRYSGVIGPLNKVKVKKRNCSPCGCKYQYSKYDEKLLKKFFSPLANYNT